MPTLDDWRVAGAFPRYLKPNEVLRHSAYGLVKPPRLRVLMVIGTLLAFVCAALVNLPIVNAGAGVFGFITFFGLFCGFYFALLYWPITKWARTYAVGLTDERLIVLRLKSPILTNKPDMTATLQVIEYLRDPTLSVVADVRPSKSTLRIADAARSFEADFPHALRGNREQVAGIVAALNTAPATSVGSDVPVAAPANARA